VTDEVRDAAARLPAGVRTLDAVHIASAQMVGDALEVLITYDKRMLEIARLPESQRAAMNPPPPRTGTTSLASNSAATATSLGLSGQGNETTSRGATSASTS
jgi:hypothetical protein